MSETAKPPTPAALQDSLFRYVESRRERIPGLLSQYLSLKECAKIQTRHFAKDLACNPLNTLWAIPYMSIRKVLEIFEKLGLELARSVIPMVPRAIKTDFQREVERLIQVELFGFPTEAIERSDLAKELDSHDEIRHYLASGQGRSLLAGAEADIRKEIAQYCEMQNGFTDLAASGGTILFAQTFFGDRSLDVFAMGRRWSALWARRKAEQHFFLGKRLGHEFYKVVHAPPPTTGQIYLATAAFLALLALFSTSVNVFSYPTRALAGLEKKQLEKLLQSVEDKLLLRFTKGTRAPNP
ncbi:MAG: DUF6635 family protein [Bdellovibrionota bacterium]